MRWVGVCVVFAWALLCAAPARATVCPDADTTYVPLINDSQVRAALVCLVNNERVTRGLAPVAEVATLDLAAQRHVDDMTARDYLGHLAPEPAPFGVTPHDRAEAAGYPGKLGGSSWEVAEVVHFVASQHGTSARAAMTNWLASAIHCNVLLAREIRHAGVGVAHGQGVGTVTDIVQLMLGAVGTKMTPLTGCPFEELAAPDAPAALPLPTPAADAEPESASTLGTTGVRLSTRQISLKRGASAAPLALQCGRSACRGTATLWARGRILGRAAVVINAGGVKRLCVPIARKYRKRLLRRSTRATLRLVVGNSRATRNLTLRG